MKKIRLNASLIDCENVSLLTGDIKVLKTTINCLIKKIIDRQKINIKKSPFLFGLWLESKDCYEMFFKKAVLELKKSNIEFFDPMIFSNSILNSITSSIAKEFNIRGYSNSFIKVDFLTLLIDFIESDLKYGFIINIIRNGKTSENLTINIILIMKSKNIIECIITDRKKSNKEFENFDIMVYNSINLRLKQGNNNVKKFDFPFLNIYSIISMFIINNRYRYKKTALLWRDDKNIKIYIYK